MASRRQGLACRPSPGGQLSALLEVRGATVRLGAVDILAGVDLDVAAGTAVGLVGPNGAGKTTLLDAVSGFVSMTAGTVRLGGTEVTGLAPHRRARLGLGRTFQALDLFDDLTVKENLQVAAEATPGGRRRRGDLPAGDPVEGLEDRLTATLANDERKGVALARALAGTPRLVLLDEPAAGLDASARRMLAARIRSLVDSGTAVLVADHDLELVLALCDQICVLDFGRTIAAGSPDSVRSDPAVAAAYLGDPLAHGGRAGGGAASGRTDPPSRRADGTRLLEARGLVAGYGGAPVVHGVDLDVSPGEVVALLGPNGAGKTTTLRALSGALPLDGGMATVLGAPVDGRTHRLARRGLAHVPQGRAVLASLTVCENLRLAARGPAPARAKAVEDVLNRFPALVPLLERRAGGLSGGEQQILALARAFASRPRLLLVDELSLGLAPRPARQAVEAVRQAAGRGAGVLLVEQHPALALGVADRAVVLARGRVVFSGAAGHLAAQPQVLEAAYLGAAGSPPTRE